MIDTNAVVLAVIAAAQVVILAYLNRRTADGVKQEARTDGDRREGKLDVITEHVNGNLQAVRTELADARTELAALKQKHGETDAP